MDSIETRIANANGEVEQLTNSFIMAKSDLLRATIEKKMTELEVYLKDLNAQKARKKLERGLKITKAQILEFITELVKGDTNDKAFKREQLTGWFIKCILMMVVFLCLSISLI